MIAKGWHDPPLLPDRGARDRNAALFGDRLQTYRFAAEGTYSIDAEYKAGTLTPPVKGTVFVTVLSFDNTAPTIDIPQLQVRRNGQPCAFVGTPAACTVQPGDFIEFVVSANDNKSLSEVSYTAFFATAGGAGTLRTRSVIAPSNLALPLNQSFAFTVPGAAFLEDVNLSALAIDGAGNRATSTQLILRVSFSTFGGRAASLVARDLGGGVVNQPSGRLWTTDGAGSQDLLTISGAPPPGVPGVTPFVSYGNGANLTGLALGNAAAAKLLVNVGAVAEADRVTIAGTTYELNSADPCAGPVTCVNVASLAPSAVASALATCITTGAGCTVGSPAGAAATAHPNVQAVVSSTPGITVVIAARVAGAAGNLLTATSASCPRLTFNAALCPAGGQSFAEGHDPSVFVGQTGGGFPRSQVFPFPLTLTAPFPRSVTANRGVFDMANPADHEQLGLAVKELAGQSTRTFRALAFYFADDTQGADRLRGVRFVDAAAGAVLFSSAGVNGGRPGCGDCIRGTNELTVPLRSFNSLWDVTVDGANGCLLVSDDGNGSVYAVDTRDPAVVDPLVTLIATGLNQPRGLAFGPSGKLFIAVRGANAVVRIGPSADPTDCL